MHQALFPPVLESRRRPRFVINVPMPARFATYEILLFDISESGCRILHADPLKIGVSGTLQFQNPSTKDGLQFEGRVVWSHLAKQGSTFEGQSYRSAMRFNGVDEENHAALARFVRMFGHHDPDSLVRKRETLERKVEAKRNGIAMYKSREEIPPAVLSKIIEAREFLALNPGLAAQWYQRARYSRITMSRGDNFPHRDEVIALYELLGRHYPVNVISMVLSSPAK